MLDLISVKQKLRSAQESAPKMKDQERKEGAEASAGGTAKASSFSQV
jgi:hypothetical protein